MLSSPTVLNNPSIQNIIIQDQNAGLQNEIRQLFKCQTYPIFAVTDFKSMQSYINDQRIYALVNQLQDWNQKVEGNKINHGLRTELYRNSFIFTSLKNILLRSSKGSPNYETNLDKLFQWFIENSKQQNQMLFTGRKNFKQDQDWQVRKTFKSNMPFQLKNYQRRALFRTQQELACLHSKRDMYISNQKLIYFSAIKDYKSKQLRQRQEREQKQLSLSKTLLNSKKSRFQEDNCKNLQYFKGSFNLAYKTAIDFGRSCNKSFLNYKDKLKDSDQFSMVKKQKSVFTEIKNNRLNTILGKIYPKESKDSSLNKTSKSFVTSNPFQATISDFGDTIIQKRQISMKQPTIKMSLYQNSDSGQKQNTQEIVLFSEVKNWQTKGLMSNPFQKKKLLKNTKKK